MATQSLTAETLSKLRKEFESTPINLVARNVCTKIDPFDACLSRTQIEISQHVFEYKVETEGKPVTNQKTSGRCWLFAALNVMRLPFMKQHSIEEFEFSQGYLFFWDKIERCHYWLNSIVETARRGEKVDGRLVAFLLNDPSCDGGQWDMIVNLVNKYGVMPKKCFPESFSCECSQHMNAMLKSKLREFAKVLRDLVESGAAESEIQATIDKQTAIIYRIVSICLSIPPEEFVWEYYTKSKQYKSVGPITPVAFYETYVKPVFDVNDKVCLVTDPRPNHKYGLLYTVDLLGNVVGGRRTLYNNQPASLLMKVAADSIKAGEAVWFGCEVTKRFAGKLGLEDLKIHDFSLVFGTDIQTTLTKADRVIYGESSMTHAMVFTAVSGNEVATKFRVENSWGEERGEKGYLLLTADWFKEFVFEVVCDKKYVPAEVLSVFNLEPVTLPAWDPMGTLAQ
ncbi:bleomycin hydrolase-like [Arctopsyche grandis]|uniref:bleomycin hydrolase-like n=1 Tax=Arctopsyche grandis TaxID=121162 RepID=UPI00406D9A8C